MGIDSPATTPMRGGINSLGRPSTAPRQHGHGHAPVSMHVQCSSPVTPGKSPLFRTSQLHSRKKPSADAAAGGQGTKSQLEAALAERDAEIAELQEHITFEQRRLAMVESELKLTAAAAQQAEAAHLEEMTKVEGDLKRVLAERRTLMHQMQTVGVVDDAVRELYIQMKERLADDGPPTPEQLQAEKTALQSENILVVLGHLHALVKNLWAFKVEAERDMRSTRQLRQQQSAEGADALRARIRALESELRSMHQEVAAAKLKLNLESDAKEAVLQESLEAVQSMAEQHAELLHAMKGATAETENLKAALQEAHEEGRRRDTLVMSNRQLESARHFDRATQDKQLRLMQVTHTQQLAAMERGLHRMSTVLAENEKLKQQLQQAVEKAAALKKAERQSSWQALSAQVQGLQAEQVRSRWELERLAAWAMQAADAGLPSGVPPPPLPASVTANSLDVTGAGPPLSSVLVAGSFSKVAASSGLAGNARLATESTGYARKSSDKVADEQSLVGRARAVMESLRQNAMAAAREKEAVKDTDPLFKVIANVGSAHKQAVQAIKEARKELADGPAAAREAARAGAPPVSEMLLLGLGGAESYQQRGFACLAGEGTAGTLGPGDSPSVSGVGGSIARASLPPHVTGLPDWRSSSVAGAAESLFNIKVKLDAGLGPLQGAQVNRQVVGPLGTASANMDFKQRAGNVGSVQNDRP